MKIPIHWGTREEARLYRWMRGCRLALAGDSLLMRSAVYEVLLRSGEGMFDYRHGAVYLGSTRLGSPKEIRDLARADLAKSREPYVPPTPTPAPKRKKKSK